MIAGPGPAPRRTALVTGAASGLGALAAQRLAAAGWAVIAADVDEAGLARTALRSPTMHTRVCDVSEAAAIAEVAAAAGPLDRVVHAAGISLVGTALDQPLEDAERIWRVDYLGTVHVVRATLPGMLERAQGELVLFSSLAGWLPSPRLSAYAAAKAAVNAYAEVLAQEHRGGGVKIRCVCPSQVDTPQFRRIAAQDPSVVAGRAGMPAGLVLDEVERSLARDELFVFPGATARLAVRGKRYVPGLLQRVVSRMTSG
ncbi:SDR family NAD(P)-dependent oxidoreductase [Actinomadura scrupuli]|uniref:SDR family NAD(P)-dependent oxidoreductase n=1 Tax=Actinomadura scrupuli TaxID=559629 RepID=UPI003D954FC8